MHKNRITHTCIGCGTEFERAASARGRYCSQRCYWLSPRHSPDLGSRIYPRTAIIEGPGCWDWTGAIDKMGRGFLGVRQPDGRWKTTHAHRAAWELVAAPLKEGEYVLHVCDRPICIRNDDEGVYVLDGVAYAWRGHLWLADQRANVRDMTVKGRRVTSPALGEASGMAKLTEAQVRQIRERYAFRKITYAMLGNEYGVDDQTISQIIKRRAWAHVP